MITLQQVVAVSPRRLLRQGPYEEEFLPLLAGIDWCPLEVDADIIVTNAIFFPRPTPPDDGN